MFWTFSSPKFLIQGQLLRNLRQFWTNLVELATNLAPTWVKLEQLGPTWDQFCFNTGYLNPKNGTGHLKNRCFYICFFFLFFPHVGLHAILDQLEITSVRFGANLKPTWVQVESTWLQLGQTWGQLGVNLVPTWTQLTSNLS